MATMTEPKAENKTRSEEHTSELQSQSNLVCRLLLEKKKKKTDKQVSKLRSAPPQPAHSKSYDYGDWGNNCQYPDLTHYETTPRRCDTLSGAWCQMI